MSELLARLDAETVALQELRGLSTSLQDFVYVKRGRVFFSSTQQEAIQTLTARKENSAASCGRSIKTEDAKN